MHKIDIMYRKYIINRNNKIAKILDLVKHTRAQKIANLRIVSLK